MPSKKRSTIPPTLSRLERAVMARYREWLRDVQKRKLPVKMDSPRSDAAVHACAAHAEYLKGRKR